MSRTDCLVMNKQLEEFILFSLSQQTLNYIVKASKFSELAGYIFKHILFHFEHLKLM